MANRPGRKPQYKVRVTVSLSRGVKAALMATQTNMSSFLEEVATRDERVAAYLAQKGQCKVEGCQEAITLTTSVYCSLVSTLCPGWFCPEHYEEVHLAEEEK